MKIVRATNQTKATTIASQIVVAETFFGRLKGLMGKRAIAPGGGLWITPSSGIHTCWMCMPIDVVALNRDLQVIQLAHSVRPWRVAGLSLETRSVLELPSGHIRACGLEVGDRLDMAVAAG